MMFLLCVAIVILIVIIVYLYQTKDHGYWRNNGVPTAKGAHWFFGHYKEVIKSKQHIGVMFYNIYNEFPQAPLVGYYKLSTPALIVRDPEIIKMILTTDFNSFSKNEIFIIDKKDDFLAGNNPFVLQGEEWKTVRSHATPLSTISKLKTYFPNIIEVSNVMIDYVNSLCSERGVAEIETKQLSGKYTTDVVANALLGIANNTFADPDSLFATMTREIFTGRVIDNIKFIFGMLFPNIAPYLKLRFSSKRTEEILLSLTKKIMKERAEGGIVRNDLFQQMLTLRKTNAEAITDEYVSSHCFSFLADGYETSSDVICFTLFESLRLHPPGLVMLKLTTKDVKLPINNSGELITLKNNTSIAIPTYGLHMDSKYFPKPETFDPERFREDNALLKYKYIYMPFGEGPRKCLGFATSIAIPTYGLHMDSKYFPKPETFDPERFREDNALLKYKYIYMPFGEGPRKCLGFATSIAIPTYGLHMDSKYFPKPETFDPERFREDNALLKYKYIYMPFGEGPRKCLGQRVALLQVKIAIIKIIEKFRLRPSERSSYPVLIDPVTLVNRPLNGAWVCFETIK